MIIEDTLFVPLGNRQTCKPRLVMRYISDSAFPFISASYTSQLNTDLARKTHDISPGF